MHPILRNVLAVILGIVVTMAVNGGLISISASVIPPPDGVDVNDVKSLAENIDRFELKHFIFPFLAHALGSLIGAWIAAMVAATHKMTFALVIGGFHLLGGITAAFLIPAPTWFMVLDLVVSYIPMAWVGGKLATRNAV